VFLGAPQHIDDAGDESPEDHGYELVPNEERHAGQLGMDSIVKGWHDDDGYREDEEGHSPGSVLAQERLVCRVGWIRPSLACITRLHTHAK
jgi:hypothetical protein